MPRQMKKSEQLNSCMSLVLDYDEPLTSKNDILKALQKTLGENVFMIKYKNNTLFLYKENNFNHYLIVPSITYLGHPHPIFKKRVQLKTWYKDFIEEYKLLPNTTINILGLYHYDDMEIYCDFNIDDYINKKMHSSSAHIYLNDLYQGLKNGVFVKKDANSNKITVIKSINLKDFLQGDIISKDPIIDVFSKFNKEFNFNKWLKADVCIKEMLDNDWYQAKGTEWPGWFLEFKVDEFINKHNYASVVLYVGNKNKKNGLLDFDLFFPLLNFYGDLKASDVSKKQAPGNDQFNTLDAISKYGRIWYIIYEHSTIKDKDNHNEMAINRMKLIDHNFKDGDYIAYMSRMKHSVNFKRMYIFELNQINMHTVLSDFNQGHNSGISQKERVAKFLLNKENLKNSIIYTYERAEDGK